MRRISMLLAVGAIVAVVAVVAALSPAVTRGQEATPAPADAARIGLHYVLPFGPEGLNPDLTVAAEVTGTCAVESLLLGQRPDAWDCTAADDRVYDPCFENPYLADGEPVELACYTSPFSNQVVLLTHEGELSREVDAPAGESRFDPWALPWGLELANGDQCVLLSQIDLVLAGEAVYYDCTEGGAILGAPLTDGRAWAVHYQPADVSASSLVEVTAAWS